MYVIDTVSLEVKIIVLLYKVVYVYVCHNLFIKTFVNLMQSVLIFNTPLTSMVSNFAVMLHSMSHGLSNG